MESAGGFTYEVFKSDMIEEEALSLENSLILNPPLSWKLVNINLNNNLDYNIDWSKLFYYDETSPSGLRHSKDKRSGAKLGDVAGFRKFYKNGAPQEWTIGANGAHYRGHRIIYHLLFGSIPENHVVNHIDNNPHNNKICNLEVCTVQENMQRTKNHNGCLESPWDSNFGILEEAHVKFDKKLNKTYRTLYAKVRLTLDGKRKSKRFSYKKYGKVLAWEMARSFRNQLLAAVLNKDSQSTQATTA